jgi:hypothetical protein
MTLCNLVCGYQCFKGICLQLWGKGEARKCSVIPARAMKAYRRRRGITTIILELGTGRRWGVTLLLSHCPSGEGARSAHATGGWVGPRAGLVILGRKIFFPAGNPIPDHPAHSLVTILTVLPQWQEGGGTALFYLFSEDWENGFLWNVANHLPECVESFTCRSQFNSYKPKIHKT